MAKFKMVGIQHLTTADSSVRQNPDPLVEERLSKFIDKYGQTQAVVIANVDGKVGIVDGNKMLTQLKKNGAEQVLCCILGKMTKDEYLSYRILLNYHQQRIDFIGVAEMINQIAENQHQVNSVSTKTAIDVKDVERFKTLLDFDWDEFDKKTDESGQVSMFGE